jgi:hypothetical protein
MAGATTLTGWLDFADTLPEIALSIFGEAEIPITEKGAGHPKVVAATLLIRTVSNFKGAVALARARRVVEARVLTRCCFENIFYMVELEAKGYAFVRELKDDESKSRKALGERILSQRITLDEAVKDRLTAQLREINRAAPQAKFLSITEVASGGLLAQADLFYRQLSRDAAHPTLTSLNRYLKRYDEGGQTVRALDADPVVNDVELSQTVDWACVAMIGACVGVNQILEGTATGQQLPKIADQWQALSNS